MPFTANSKLVLACAIAFSAASLTACTQASPPAESAERHAKNVILFVGDGMGVSTVTAARIYDGQSQGLDGEEHSLAFDRFPNVALVKTYNTNQQVSDSAGTATAMMTGQKTRAGVINVPPDVHRRDCAEGLANPLTPLSRIAKERGKSAGFVTTTRVTHATPATTYANLPERDWEANNFLSEEIWAEGCRDMAWQLANLDVGSGLDVAMGGGRIAFFGRNGGGVRKDPDDDLVQTWLAAGDQRRFVSTVDEMAAVEPGQQVLGLFSLSHLSFMARKAEDSTEPTLSQMTAKAIDLLAADDDGFFLMVEGGRIDHGHHMGRAGWSLVEAQEFNRAVQTALDKVDLEDTLILVTADHSHVFTIAGYPTRGNPILGLVTHNDRSGEPKDEPQIASDGQPYTVVGYMNGPGAVTELPRPAPETGVDMIAQALVPFANNNIDGSVTNDETHGGEDVALYGIGAGSDGVRGVIEQNRIFDIMMDAYGWGEGTE